MVKDDIVISGDYFDDDNDGCDYEREKRYSALLDHSFCSIYIHIDITYRWYSPAEI